MTVAVSVLPDRFRLRRAPLIDPPFDDELTAVLYRPSPFEPAPPLPPEALAVASPECHTAALRFLNLCLELFNGFRSPIQMRPLIHVEHAIAVLDELARIARHLNQVRRRRQIEANVRRRQLRTCEPREGVIEVAAVLDDGGRSWAMCYRLERSNNWRCTHLRVLLRTD
jgi:hypothetical protein